MNHTGKGIIGYKQNKTLQCLSDYSLSDLTSTWYLHIITGIVVIIGEKLASTFISCRKGWFLVNFVVKIPGW